MQRTLRAKNSLKYLTVAGALAAAFAAAPLRAEDPVVVDVTAGAQHLVVGGSSIPDLIENLINAQGQFASLQAENVSNAHLNALGVPDAINLNVVGNPSTGFSARLTTVAGLDRTFTGPTRQDVEDQVSDFLEKDGTTELARLLKYLNEHSPLSVASGNPNASDALAAQATFQEYGFIESKTNKEREESEGKAAYELAFLGDVGFIESKGLKAHSYSLPISFSIFERPRWALRAQIPLNYTEIEGAQIFRAGLNLALPVLAIGSTPEHKTQWNWQVTPSGGTMASASYDLIAGGLLNNVALSSALEYTFANFHNISVGMGNQIMAIESMEVTIGDYSFDPDVSSRILKNGLKVSIPFASSWVFDIYGIDTRFIGGEAYADGYETVGGAIGYRRGKGPFMKVGAYANIGKDFTSANFQFGAGWKF